MEGEPQYNFGVGVKKRFLKNKFTASLGAMNILDRVQVVHSYDDTFNRSIFMNNGNALTVNFSLRYNFQAGVKVRAKQVDRGSGEDQQRIGGGGSQGGER